MKAFLHRSFRLSMIEILIVLAALFVLAALLVGVLLPIFSKARETTDYRPQCPDNLRQIGLAMLMYSGDFDHHFPNTHPNGSTSFEPLIREKYMQDGKVWACPARTVVLTTGANSAYRYIGSGLRDSNAWATGVSLAYDVSGNHPNNEWMNALFIDGHVEGARPGSQPWWQND